MTPYTEETNHSNVHKILLRNGGGRRQWNIFTVLEKNNTFVNREFHLHACKSSEMKVKEFHFQPLTMKRLD